MLDNIIKKNIAVLHYFYTIFVLPGIYVLRFLFLFLHQIATKGRALLLLLLFIFCYLSNYKFNLQGYTLHLIKSGA